MRSFIARIKKKYWDKNLETPDGSHLFGVVMEGPLPRRITETLGKHWVAHWKFWAGSAVALCAAYMQVKS